jgi:2-polyprenyl-6-methoxyphenol hydroxylase-like FAD-dependent oxidoreductase
MKDNVTPRSDGDRRTSVLIVGGGPVGLALAADLGRRDVPCMLVEQHAPHVRSARIMLISVRTMEMCRSFGVADKVRNWGFPADYPQDNVWATNLNGYRLAHVPMRSLGDSKPSPYSPEFQAHCPQTYLEPILEELASSFPSVTIRHNTKFVGLEQDDEGVTVRLENAQTGEPEVVTAAYLVGCDGYSSSVRQELGIRMRGQDFIDYSLSIEFLCEDLQVLHRQGRALRYVFIGPEGTWGSLMAVDGRKRWRILLYGINEDPSAIDVHAVIRRMVGRDFDYTLDSAKLWERRAVIADSFQDGRVFLAGDAAHTHLPNGGFGMNTGLGDAMNLGWKLAGVVDGWAEPAMLDSYDIERRPVCHRAMEEALAEFRRFTASPSIAHIDAPTPKGEETRKAIGRGIQTAYDEARGWDRLGIHLGHIYHPSPIIVRDGTPLPQDDTFDYDPTSFPGARAPHAWLADGRSTLDLFGDGYVLLTFGPARPDATALIEAALLRDFPLTLHHIQAAVIAELYDTRFVLVRPDGHVAWRGDRLPQDCVALLDHIRGARALRAMIARLSADGLA